MSKKKDFYKVGFKKLRFHQKHSFVEKRPNHIYIYNQSSIFFKYFITLHVSQVTVDDLLPGLMLTLHHVDKPSAINHPDAEGLVTEIKWIS